MTEMGWGANSDQAAAPNKFHHCGEASQSQSNALTVGAEIGDRRSGQSGCPLLPEKFRGTANLSTFSANADEARAW
jgi:hypothetical protein